MYSITKEFSFSASHQLSGLPDDHPCSRLHGHNYRVKVTLYAIRLDEVGFVLDYRALDVFKTWLDENCDHYHLNETFSCNPTAENLAASFYDKVLGIIVVNKWRQDIQLRVDVSETDKTWASYEPDALIGQE
jgi:6-pyruvoyltetrahydropterin/6-carboxytetrahydropterin synthase